MTLPHLSLDLDPTTATIPTHQASLGTEVRVLEVAFGHSQQKDNVRFSDDSQRPSQGE